MHKIKRWWHVDGRSGAKNLKKSPATITTFILRVRPVRRKKKRSPIGVGSAFVEKGVVGMQVHGPYGDGTGTHNR